MKGFIRKLTACAAPAAVWLVPAGCSTYDQCVDPCWPQRYTAIAREEVREPLGTQAANGLYLEQTLWNHHFEEGTAELRPGGRHLLDRLSRRRPEPFKEIFVQTAYDYKFDAAKDAAANAEARAQLDVERTQVVQKYLDYTRPDLAFRIGIHDPTPVGMSGEEAGRIVRETLATPPRGAVQTEREQAERDITDQKVDQDVNRRSTESIDFERKDTTGTPEE